MGVEEIVQGRKPVYKYRDFLSAVLLNGIGEALISKSTITKAEGKGKAIPVTGYGGR
jgi:hypothetical protein